MAATHPASAYAAHGLSVGDEVDFAVLEEYWVPARVERLETGPAPLVVPPGSSPPPAPRGLSSSPGSASTTASSNAATPVRFVTLRFACGSHDVRHRLDLSVVAEARRIASACEWLQNLQTTTPFFFLWYRGTGHTK